MNDKNKMFCFQCEQTAGCSGCTGNAGVCGKTSSVSALQDELTGALIGLARACRDVPVTGRTSRIILEGLFTTVTNVSFDGDSIREPGTGRKSRHCAGLPGLRRPLRPK